MTTAERRTDERDGYPPPAVTAAVLALFAVVLAVWAVAAIGETSARVFASYTQVEALIVDEHTDERLVADRRGSRPVSFRVVTVELPDGTLADLPSDALQVGTTATAYSSDDGAVVETPPPPPGPLEWTLCLALAAAAVVLAFMAIRSALRLSRARSE